MKLQLLPSSFDDTGSATKRQHLTCFVVDDTVAFDAGSLAMASSRTQKNKVRNIVLSHAHLDHIAGLPLFLDDLFESLTEPVCIHASPEIIDVLEANIFNWSVYPRFSELSNKHGTVLEYKPFSPNEVFSAAHIIVRAIEVNHKVPSFGFTISNGDVTIAMTGDTASTDTFWNVVNNVDDIAAVLIECAFPNELQDLASTSHHLTPDGLGEEVNKLKRAGCEIYVINMKPEYRERTVAQINELGLQNVQFLEVGKVYEW